MSKLDQLHSRPATLILTTRLDARYLATLVRFWHSQGEKPRSNSELIRLCVESFAEFLILNGKIDFVQTHHDAIEILENTGLKVDKINPRNVAKALMAEGATIEPLQAPSIDPGHQSTVASNPISPSGPETEAAKAAMERLMNDDLKKRVDDANERTREFKEGLLNPNTSSEES